MSRIVYDTETGEVLGELDQGDKVVKAKSIESYQSRKKRLSIIDQERLDEGNLEVWSMDKFYKGNVEELKEVMDSLCTNEKAFLFSIAPYISYEHCCLEFANRVDVTFEHLLDIVGFGRTTLKETIAKLIKKDILYKGKNSVNNQYFVNPWLFCKGQRINVVLKNMFKNYKIRVMGGKKWREI